MRPDLSEPDFGEWCGRFPGGLGPSAFSAPAWQGLMRAEEGAGWALRWLVVAARGARLSLPVLARRTWTGRWVLATRPIAYYVTPIEGELAASEDLEALLAGVASTRVLRFSLWLAPWSGLTVAPSWRSFGRFRVSTSETFAIRLADGAGAHVAAQLGRTRRRHLAANERRKLEVTTLHDPALRDAYHSLYLRAHAERSFVGRPFSRAFLEGAATRLDGGGELCLALENGRVVGGGVLLFDRRAVHYFQGAVDRSARDVSPHDAIYLHALRRAEERGLEWLNLGGVNPGNEGLVRFKRSWGAVPLPVLGVAWRSAPWIPVERLLRGGPS